MIKRETIFSADGLHRFQLWREWSDDLFLNRTKEGFVQFIGLNPSTADDKTDDPTIRRCKDFTKRWGYNSMCMTNLFTFITPYPKNLPDIEDGVKIRSRQIVFEIATEAKIVICCWGKFVCAKFQARLILTHLKEKGVQAFHLGLNDDGSPKHPLYLKADTQPQPYEIR